MHRRRPSDIPTPTRRVALGLLALLATAGPWVAAQGVDGAPAAEKFISEVGNETVAILGQKGVAKNDKIQELARLLDRSTDLDLVARLVLGQYWRSASEAQRKEYTALFRALVLKTMSDQLSNYGGETYKITGSRQADDRDSVVSTQILRPNGGPPINVDWRLREADGRLLIIDIVAEGISMLITQRSQVTDIASRQGIDGLLATMRQRLKGQA